VAQYGIPFFGYFNCIFFMPEVFIYEEALVDLFVCMPHRAIGERSLKPEPAVIALQKSAIHQNKPGLIFYAAPMEFKLSINRFVLEGVKKKASIEPLNNRRQ
ncbi:hypothetical protein KI387_002265, partial [Taxus chinensis]